MGRGRNKPSVKYGDALPLIQGFTYMPSAVAYIGEGGRRYGRHNFRCGILMPHDSPITWQGGVADGALIVRNADNAVCAQLPFC